ncbi:hypothetical protein NKI79_13155 [Mesorhizobium sp. M0340]|uniref:hypothetical protein n=1 Tax=Mesorhizobium sp. M0340 TaxID=2956939 RepID=UPI00333BD31A
MNTTFLEASERETGIPGFMLNFGHRFQMARRTIAYGAIVFIGTFGVMALILIVFGHPS